MSRLNTQFGYRGARALHGFTPKLFWVLCFVGVSCSAIGDSMEFTRLTDLGNWSPGVGPKAFVYADQLWCLDDDNLWVSTTGQVWKDMGGWSGEGGWAAIGFVAFEGRVWLLRDRARQLWSSENGFTWDLVSDTMPWEPRRNPELLAYRGKLWMLGGGGQNDSPTDVWASADGMDWELITPEAGWLSRSAEQDFALAYGRRLWVFPGTGHGEYSWDIWNRGNIWSSETGSEWQLGGPGGLRYAGYGSSALVFGGRMWSMDGMGTSGAIDPDDGYFTCIVPIGQLLSSVGTTAWVEHSTNLESDLRNFSASAVFRSRMWLIGGQADFGLPGDCWDLRIRNLEEIWHSGPPLGAADLCFENLVVQGDFEGLGPRAAWVDSQPEGEAVLCGPGDCWIDAPRSGTSWMQIPARVGLEAVWASQAVYVPEAAHAELKFHVRASSDAGPAVFEVGLDNTWQSYEVVDPVGLSDYEMVRLDVSAFADGGRHDLTFYNESYENGGVYPAALQIDDVCLQVSEEPFVYEGEPEGEPDGESIPIVPLEGEHSHPEGDLTPEGQPEEGQPEEGQPEEGGAPPDGEPEEGQPEEGAPPLDGELPEGQPEEGAPPLDGEAAEGAVPEGEGEGEAAEGQPAEGAVSEGEGEGEPEEGALPEGEGEGEPEEGQPAEGAEGQAPPEGEAEPAGSEGDAPVEGDLPEGEGIPVDGEAGEGEAPEAESTSDGESQAEGDAGEGEAEPEPDDGEPGSPPPSDGESPEAESPEGEIEGEAKPVKFLNCGETPGAPAASFLGDALVVCLAAMWLSVYRRRAAAK